MSKKQTQAGLNRQLNAAMAAQLRQNGYPSATTNNKGLLVFADPEEARRWKAGVDKLFSQAQAKEPAGAPPAIGPKELASRLKAAIAKRASQNTPAPTTPATHSRPAPAGPYSQGQLDAMMDMPCASHRRH